MVMAWCWAGDKPLVGQLMSQFTDPYFSVEAKNSQFTLHLLAKFHDEVIKWKHFPCYWPFVRGINRWPVNPPHKGQWRMFSVICAWTNGCANNGYAGDLRCHHAHYDVTVMCVSPLCHIVPDACWMDVHSHNQDFGLHAVWKKLMIKIFYLCQYNMYVSRKTN